MTTLVLVGVALAVNYGTGTFQGRVETIGTSQRGAAVVKVKPGKARITKIVANFNCTGVEGVPDRLPMPAGSKWTKVEQGPAGGGAVVRIEGTRQVRGESFDVVGKVFLGLRDDSVSGNFNARLRGDTGCGDTYASFTATRAR